MKHPEIRSWGVTEATRPHVLAGTVQSMETNTPRPTPRPAPVRYVDRVDDRLPHDPEFAHIHKVRHGAQAAVFVGRASHGEVTVTMTWEGPDLDSQLAILDAFTDLVSQAQALPIPLTVVVPTRFGLRLLAAGFTDEHVIVGARTGPNYLQQTHHEAQQWKTRMANQQVWTNVRQVATDASVGLASGSAAIACVAEDGHTATLRLEQRYNVTRCELRAILLALETFHGSLRILTDSQAAVRLVTGDRQTRSAQKYSTLLARIDAAMSGRVVAIEWVRGHNGHPLNEAADRLAVATRRAAELDIPPSVQRHIRQRITADLLVA